MGRGTRAAVYARISVDRDGTSEAPDRQLEICRNRCAEQGWTIEAEFVERDTSAFTKAKVRPQYDAMLDLVRSGQVDVVVAWKLDRVSRRVSELARLVEEFREMGVALVCPGDGVDTGTPAGALVATIIGAIAQMESEANSQRRLAKNRSDAIKGKYVKGGFRAFGRNLDGSIVEAEAQAIREVAEAVIAGETLASQARSLNAKGLTTATGRLWGGTSLGQALRQPHLRGVRVHNDQEHQGAFDPILDTATALRLRDRLDNNPVPRKGRDHLLGGLAFCGRCGGKMNLGSVKHPKDPSKPRHTRYQCIRYERPGNCGAVSASENGTDKVVTEQFFTRARELLVAGLLDYTYDDEADQESAARQIAENAQAQSELAHARYVSRTISEADYTRLWLELQEGVDEAEAQLERLKKARSQPARDFDWFGSDPEAAWELMPVIDRRTTLRSLIERVLILPTEQRGGNRFDPRRVQVVWHNHAVLPDWLVEARDDTPAPKDREALRQRFLDRGWISENGQP